jgi:hypothetical protein
MNASVTVTFLPRWKQSLRRHTVIRWLSTMVDSVYRTRSLGVAAEGLPDQYADGRAARVWHRYIGSVSARTSVYRSWISNFFRSKGLSHILDVACGTGQVADDSFLA